MAANSKGSEKLLKRLMSEGLYVSLHINEPKGSFGGALLKPSKLPNGTMKAEGTTLRNTTQISLGRATSGGNAAYAGIWISSRDLLASVRLKNSLAISVGAEIVLPRNTLTIKVL